MKKIFLLLTGVILVISLNAQDDADTNWRTNGDISLMFAQSSFSNWAAGGENSLSFNSFFNYYAGYFKANTKWETMLGLAYGQTKTGELDYRKSEDKIDLASVYGLKASEKWYYSANFNFKTQFAPGYKYFDDDPTMDKVKISNFLAPAYISIGPGMEYRPADFFSIYMSPSTARWIIVNDQTLADAGAFGVEPAKLDDTGIPIAGTGEKSKFEFGAYVRFMFVKDLWTNVNLSTKLELFSDYLNNPQNIDVNWDTQINLKVNDWISAMFGLTVFYDHDTPVIDKDDKVGPRTQVKELFSAGLTYKFKNRNMPDE